MDEDMRAMPRHVHAMCRPVQTSADDGPGNVRANNLTSKWEVRDLAS